MTRTALSNRRSGLSTAAASIALLLASAIGPFDAHADQPANSPRSFAAVDAHLPLADLEQAYWECDYAATTWGVSLGEGALCGVIYEELKRRKFAGDFQAVLEWWRQHKIAEYEALGRRYAAKARPEAQSSSNIAFPAVPPMSFQ